VSSIAFSPNGKRIASASRDHTINIWDPIAGGEPLLTLTGHANEVWSIAYSPDGEKLLSTSEDNTIRMWVLNTGEKKVILDDVRAVDLDFSPDGKRIAFSSDNKFPNFQVWEVLDSEQSLPSSLPSTSPSSLPSTSPSSLSSTPPSSHPTNKPIMKIVQNRRVFALSGHGSMVRSVNYNPSGSRIVSGGCDRHIKVWDAISGGNPIFSFDAITGIGLDCVYSTEYSHNGKKIVSGADDNSVKMWNAFNGKNIFTIQLDGTVRSVGFNNDSSRIVSSSREAVQIWNARQGSSIMNLTGHSELVQVVKYSPDGTLVASGSYDKTIKIWDAINEGPAKLTLTGHTGVVSSIAFSPNGKRIASASMDHTINIWDPIAGGEPLLILTGHLGAVLSIAYSPDGRNIASSSVDNTVEIWDAKIGGRPILTITEVGKVLDIDFNHDGSRITLARDNHNVDIWNIFATQGPTTIPPISPAFYPTFPPIKATVKTENSFSLSGHTSYVVSVRYSPDGSRIVSGACDKTIKIWDAVTGSHIMTLGDHKGCVNSVEYSRDGTYIVSGSSDKSIKMWDASSGSVMFTIPLDAEVKSVGFNKDISRIVSSSGNLVQIWDALQSSSIMDLTGHTELVNAVQYSPDGTLIASCSNDNTIKIWDAIKKGPAKITFTGHNSNVNSIVFSPDGRRLASASSDNTVKIWDITTYGEALLTRESLHDIWSVSFFPDGSKVAFGGDGEIQIWDTETGSGNLILSIEDLGIAEVKDIDFSSDGTRIAFSSAPDKIEVWEIFSIPTSPIAWIEMVATKSKILSLVGHQSYSRSVRYSPTGTRIVSGSCDKTIRTWDAVTGSSIMTLDGHTGCVHSVEYNYDGTRIVSGSSDNSIKMWDVLDNGSLIYTISLDDDVNSVDFNKDGSRIVSSSGKLVQIWDTAKGDQYIELFGHSQFVRAAKYSPDGTLIASCSDDETIKIWDAINGGPAKFTLTGHEGIVNSVVFSPDGKRLASASMDNTIKIWDVTNDGEALLTLSENTSAIFSVAFSPDGTKLASLEWDDTVNGSIKIWDAELGGDSTMTIDESNVGFGGSVDFSPDGTRIVFGDVDDYDIEVWEVFSPLIERLPPIRTDRQDGGIGARVLFSCILSLVAIVLTYSVVFRKTEQPKEEFDDITYEDLPALRRNIV